MRRYLWLLSGLLASGLGYHYIANGPLSLGLLWCGTALADGLLFLTDRTE